MDKKKIEKVQKLAKEIDNFKDCYKDCVLWGSALDGDVKAEQILAWLIEYPYMAEIAANIKRLDT